MEPAVGSGATAGMATDAATQRAAQLREVAARAVDGSLCSPDEFCEGFPTLSGTHRAVLEHVYLQTQGCLRENATVRIRAPRRAAPPFPWRRPLTRASALCLGACMAMAGRVRRDLW